MFFILCLCFLCVHSYQYSRIVLLPGYGCCKNDYQDFVTNGQKLGVSVDVGEHKIMRNQNNCCIFFQ